MNIRLVQHEPPNPRAAAENRRLFEQHGVTCVNFLGTAGCGKTTLIDNILPRLHGQARVGVLTADNVSQADGEQLAQHGVPTVQVLTDRESYLSPAQVRAALNELPLNELDLLLIENIGNGIRPAQTDLGEHLRVAVMSVAAGDRVATKYPMLVRDAAVLVLAKYDLMPHVQFDLNKTVHGLRRLNPDAEIICTDTRNRVGIDRLAGWLLGYVRAGRRESMPESAMDAEPVVT